MLIVAGARVDIAVAFFDVVVNVLALEAEEEWPGPLLCSF